MRAIFCLAYAYQSAGQYKFNEGTCIFKGPSDIQKLEINSEEGTYWLYRATWQVDVANDQGKVLYSNVAALYNYGWHSEDEARENLESIPTGENSTTCSYPVGGPYPYPLAARFGKVDIRAAYVGVPEDTVVSERRKFLDLFISGIFFVSLVGCICCCWIGCFIRVKLKLNRRSR
eukprot:TRINITY_DN1039_c0_g2_i2.p1 TRINITY_DN1039_c0_g2~~TRINITY_DN1039_c0_g2_i2.p1  ORF type:complete len:175 (+),score=11.54 TRINITY_DN1039_c0_g2_i2:65-589(+)